MEGGVQWQIVGRNRSMMMPEDLAISSAWQRCDAWRLSHAKDAPKPKPRPGGGSASQQQTQRRKEQPSHERNPNIGQGR